MQRIRIGTRGSKLALWQAEHIRARLLAIDSSLHIDLVKITTTGDRVTGPLAQHGGKALYLKEIEEALLRNDVDCAVHSLKDVPADLPEGLQLFAVAEREDPRDLLLLREGKTLAEIPSGGVIGTSSLRRQWQLHALRPDCRIAPLRGNVDTRVRKLMAGEYDAIVLAMAGLKRLGFITGDGEWVMGDGDPLPPTPNPQPLAPVQCLPAIGQAAVVVEGRAQDAALAALVRKAVHHAPTWIAVAAERAVMRAVGGDCFTPLAAHARISMHHLLTLVGWLATTDGAHVVRAERQAELPNGADALVVAESCGRMLGEELVVRLQHSNT